MGIDIKRVTRGGLLGFHCATLPFSFEGMSMYYWCLNSFYICPNAAYSYLGAILIKTSKYTLFQIHQELNGGVRQTSNGSEGIQARNRNDLRKENSTKLRQKSMQK